LATVVRGKCLDLLSLIGESDSADAARRAVSAAERVFPPGTRMERREVWISKLVQLDKDSIKIEKGDSGGARSCEPP